MRYVTVTRELAQDRCMVTWAQFGREVFGVSGLNFLGLNPKGPYLSLEKKNFEMCSLTP